MATRVKCVSKECVTHDGYVFYTRRTTNGTRYMFCKSNRKLGCPATAKIQPTGEFIVIKAPHNHPREGYIHGAEFKRQLREACVEERGTLKNIYEHAATRNPNGAVAVPFNSIRSSMLRWRQSTTPKVPANLEELAEICQSGSVNAGGDCAVIFGNEDFIRNFSESQYTFIDGTFKVVPRRPSFMQILTVFATCMDHAFPIIHIFMEKRTKVLYEAVFAYLLRTFPDFVNETVVTDYEVALVDALRATYPRASLRGCFFHFCQAILRKAKTLGVVRQIEGNLNGRNLLRKYYALALLPETHIVPAFESLQDNMELGAIFKELHDYVRRQWIERVTPQHFSVFKQRHRTNNVMESYHRRLNSKLVRHPGVWDLMDTLIDIQNTASIELAQLEHQGKVFRIAKKNVVFNNRLNKAWDKLAAGHFNVGDFLRQAVHFVGGLDDQLHNWTEAINEDSELPLMPLLHNPPLFEPLPRPLVAPNLPLFVPATSPPPLIYFRQAVPSPPNLRRNSPVHPIPDQFPIPRPPSPHRIPLEPPAPLPDHLPFPTYNFPPIPEEIGRLFAQLGNDDIPTLENMVVRRWEPRIPATTYEEDSMPALLRCRVCYLNKVQYVIACGHAFCPSCMDTLFNVQTPRCGICRAGCNSDPLPFYLG